MSNRHDGWELVEYEWDPAMKIGTFVYERTRIDTGEIQTKTIAREQNGDNWKF